MDKNEILEKSRIENENGDEREKQLVLKAEKNSSAASYLTGLLLCGILSIIDAILKNGPSNNMSCLYTGMFAANEITKFVHNKEPRHLVFGIIFSLFSITFFIMYILNLIG